MRNQEEVFFISQSSSLKNINMAMMNNRFEYKKEEREGVFIFTLIGSLDIGTVSAMKADLDSLLSTGQHKVLFDLYDLEQVDSSGIGAIIALFKRVRSNNGEMKISRLIGQPKEIFSLLRLDRVFEIHNALDEALKSFR
jgi:anti-sigma B factor antagonist